MTDPSAGQESRKGLIFGLAAYGMWGLFPLYWPLLKPAGAMEILAHRMVWSLVVMAVLLGLRRDWSVDRASYADPPAWSSCRGAAVLVAVNWGVYIWAVNKGHVVETSLGYFINPLVTVLLGVLILRERLRPLQWTAVGIGAAAVVDTGRRLRPAAVDRADPGLLVRQLRAVEEDRQCPARRVAWRSRAAFSSCPPSCTSPSSRRTAPRRSATRTGR